METTISVRIDPHVHSEGSYDGREPVELILEHASEIGLDGVVVTDHDTIEESRRAAELAPEFDLIGIPGVEVSTKAGHLLAIGVEECPPKGQSFAETVSYIRDLGGIAITPHPFQRTRHGVRKRNLSDCDGIEVYNSMLFTGYRNRRAHKFAERRDYPKIGASDAHYLPNIGRAVTEIHVDESEVSFTEETVDGDRLIDAIREGDTTIHGKRTPIHKSARQYAIGASKKSLYLLTSQLPFLPTIPSAFDQ
ncbi:PHP domain-containing protein [Haladaptatus sp. DYSN1]|uniref:PHP domain-containing protein n=1 Tax=unclassified Haladaptatus TaxID=2622732 RepID=UPI002404DB3D|nr:PHP domain-containing protein [Haladaptatus sp. DYSN1]